MRKILFMLAFALLCTASYAQMAQFQALYIYNFAKNTGWPPADAGRELVITVVGDNAIASELSKLAKTRKIGTRSVVIKESATPTGIAKSDIIYLGEAKSGQISTLVNAQSGNTVLIVAGRKGLCANGAGICFVDNGGKLGFEISESNIKKNGLSVSSKLVTLGTAVN